MRTREKQVARNPRRFKPAHFIPKWLIVPVRNLVEGGYETEISLIRKRLPDGNGLVLDVGVGAGETEQAVPAGNLVGIEINEYLVKTAAAKRHGRFVRGDATALPFRDDSFSSVVLCKTGHHLDSESLSAVASESYRVLEPGGRLIFLDPVPASGRTTLIHKIIAALEAGNHHREFVESAAFFSDFKFDGVESFRKRGFDFYIAVFDKL